MLSGYRQTIGLLSILTALGLLFQRGGLQHEPTRFPSSYGYGDH